MDDNLLIQAIKILGYRPAVCKGLSTYENGYLLCPREATLEDLKSVGKLEQYMNEKLSDVAIEDIHNKVKELA